MDANSHMFELSIGDIIAIAAVVLQACHYYIKEKEWKMRWESRLIRMWNLCFPNEQIEHKD